MGGPNQLSPEIEARLNNLSPEELDFLSTLPPGELAEVLSHSPAGPAVPATPPNPAESFRSGVSDLLGTAVDQSIGAEGSPQRTAVEDTAKVLGGAGAEVGKTLLENAVLGAATEGGTVLGKLAGAGLKSPVGRALLESAGSTLGFSGGDAGLDLAEGQPVSVDPLGAGISALVPGAPLLLQGLGKTAVGAGRVARAVAPSKLGQTLMSYIETAAQKAARVASGPANVPAAFDMGGSQFDIREPIIAADAVQRLEQRGIFRAAEKTSWSERFGGENSVYTSFAKIRKAFEREKVRLQGNVGKHGSYGRSVSAADVPVAGEVGRRAREISGIPGTETALGDIEDAYNAVLGKYTAETGLGKVDKQATRIIEQEIEKLRDLTLSPEEMTRLNIARESVKRAEREIANSDIAAFRPVSELTPQEIQKIFRVEFDKETGEMLAGKGMDKWQNYQTALQDIDKLVAESRARKVKYVDIYKKRIATSELAKYGGDAENAALQSQVMTELTDSLRHGFENPIAQRSGTAGEMFLKAKAELADVLTVEDFVYKAEANEKVPRFAHLLSFGPKATIVRNVASALRSNNFRLTKRNIGLGLERVANLAGGQAKSMGQIAMDNPLPAKLLDSAGQYTLKVADVMGSHDRPVSWLVNSIVNATAYEFLSTQGVTDASAEEMDEILGSPEVQQLVQQTSQTAQQELQGLQRALSLGDHEAAGMELSRISKMFPEAFATPKTGIRGEVEVDGKPRLYADEDRERFRAMLRSTKDVPVDQKAELMDEVNRTGTVLYVPNAIRPKRPRPAPDEATAGSLLQ